jgi:acyl carrier protein
MVPSLLIALSEWPLTQNGKIDYTVLASSAADCGASVIDSPHDQIEYGLVELWKDVLAVPAVGRESHFVELGGHSLAMVQLTLAIEARYGVEMPMSALREFPILSDLAKVIRFKIDECNRMEAEIAFELDGKSDDELRSMIKNLE